MVYNYFFWDVGESLHPSAQAEIAMYCHPHVQGSPGSQSELPRWQQD